MSKTKRNSVYQVLRLVFVTLFNLLFVKYTIQLIGYNDYGYFVSTISTILTLQFINNILVSVSSRYLSFAVGTGVEEDIRSEFASSFKLHLGLGIFVLLAGLCFIPFVLSNGDLVNSDSQLKGLKFLYVGSLVVSFMTILSAPYQAVLVAHENFKIKTLVEIGNAFFKLICVALMFLLPYTKFETLSYSFPVLTILTPFIFIAYTYFKYRKLCSHRESVRWNSVREKLNFSIWTSLGAFTQLLKTQILVVIFMHYYGPSSSSVASIINQIFFAAWSLIIVYAQVNHPVIIKAYSRNEGEILNEIY